MAGSYVRCSADALTRNGLAGPDDDGRGQRLLTESASVRGQLLEFVLLALVSKGHAGTPLEQQPWSVANRHAEHQLERLERNVNPLVRW